MRSRRLAMGLALSLGAAVAATGGPVANAAVPKPVRLTIETLPTGTREALLDVEFVNAQRGFAVGAYTTLVSTDDGGRTWKRHDLKAPDDAKGDANALTGLSFPDDKHGYVVGGGAGPRVLATSDGGQTWEPRSELPPVQSVVDDPAVARWGGIDDVSFTDADHGHAVVSTNGAVFATADGGRSWTWQGRPEIGQPRRVEFVDRNRGWVVGGVGELAWATDDGGNTWRQQQGEIDPFFGVTQAAFLDLAFPDASHGYVVRYDGEVLATRDGGATWQALRTDQPERFQAVAFGDRLRGVVVGSVITDRQKATVLVTENGGQSWTSRLLQDISILWGVDFASPDTAYAVGCKRKLPGVGDGSPLAAGVDTNCQESAVVKISLLGEGGANGGGQGRGTNWLLPAAGVAGVLIVAGLAVRARRR